MFSEADLTALFLTAKLATIVTIVLLGLGTPLAAWLAGTSSRWKGPISAVVALPLVLPPTVIGFYLLLWMGPQGWFGEITQTIGLGTLPFTFPGLVIASCVYSLPFVVQPIQNAIEAVGTRPHEAAATLGASPLDRFFTITLPLAKSGFVTAAVLGFVHTVGEFGVVLMIGGNIPGETLVVSVQIYDHVEALDYSAANSLSLLLVAVAVLALLFVYRTNPFQPLRSKI